jgi:multifunctional methyltransferase subunit TRM112
MFTNHLFLYRVRLITQNLLSCPSKECSYPANFPLKFAQVETLEQVEAEFNEDFIRGFLRKLEWAALRQSAAEVS